MASKPPSGASMFDECDTPFTDVTKSSILSVSGRSLLKLYVGWQTSFGQQGFFFLKNKDKLAIKQVVNNWFL